MQVQNAYSTFFSGRWHLAGELHFCAVIPAQSLSLIVNGQTNISTGISAIAFQIVAFNFSVVAGRLLYTLLLRWSHKKKSHWQIRTCGRQLPNNDSCQTTIVQQPPIFVPWAIKDIDLSCWNQASSIYGNICSHCGAKVSINVPIWCDCNRKGILVLNKIRTYYAIQ